MKKTIYTLQGEYPGTKLKGKEKYKKLYHYTSFDSFVKIWFSQTLKFSPLPNVNDIQEAESSFSPYNINWLPVLAAYKDVRMSYKQISFTMDYDSYFKGCMSPMMWGLYADKRKGVCIELDFEKLQLTENCIAHPIMYKKILRKNQKIDPNVQTKKQVRDYIKKNKLDIFFTKHKCWEGENEYRIVSDKDDFLNIQDAISAVYLTSCCSTECLLVEKMVNGAVPVKYLKYFATIDNMALPALFDTQSSREENERAMSNPDNALLQWGNKIDDFYSQHREDEDFPLYLKIL